MAAASRGVVSGKAWTFGQHQHRDLADPPQIQEIAPQRIGLADRVDRRKCEPGGEPPKQRGVQFTIGEDRETVWQENAGGIAPGLLKALVAEPDALPPSEPVSGPASTRARDLDARLAAERAEHHGDARADLGQ